MLWKLLLSFAVLGGVLGLAWALSRRSQARMQKQKPKEIEHDDDDRPSGA